jgi:xanthine dehydrogenase YagS FAD-binding subunit
MSGNICRCGAYSNIATPSPKWLGARRMNAFTYDRARSPAEARRCALNTPGAKFIAGGTNLLDLMKLEIETPTHLIDVNGLGLDRIEATPEGGLRIGALVRNTDLAADPRVRRDYGVLSRALLAGASGQLRNKATTAGNLLAADALSLFLRHQPAVQQAQARQWLFRDRRHQPPARRHRDERRLHRDASERHGCRDARARCSVATVRPDGSARTIPIADFHRLPGNTPHIETTLEARRTDHVVTLPKPVGRHAALSEGARSRVLCVRAGVGRCDRSAGRNGARRARRCRPQAVAGRGGADAQMPRGAKAVADRLSPARNRPTKTRSNCRSSSARSARALAKAKG